MAVAQFQEKEGFWCWTKKLKYYFGTVLEKLNFYQRVMYQQWDAI